MNTRDKLLTILLVSFFSLGTANTIASDGFNIKKKNNTYILKSGDKTAELQINWWNKLNKFSVFSWPKRETDRQGQNLKILAIAYLTFNRNNVTDIDYTHKEDDPDIDFFLSNLLSKYQKI